MSTPGNTHGLSLKKKDYMAHTHTPLSYSYTEMYLEYLASPKYFVATACLDSLFGPPPPNFTLC